MTDPERIAQLEGWVERLDQDVRDIKEEQAAAMSRQQESALEARDLRGELATAIGLLQTHQAWHDKHDERKYKATDIVLALGMLALGIFTAIRG
jgi:regulator of replication initiation timing